MALTIDATGLSNIWTCESVTGAVGNKPALDSEIYKEGSNSVDFTSTQNAYAAFDGTIPNSGDLSNEHIRAWYTSITFPNMNNYATGGLRFYVTDGTNTSYWNIAGKDTYQGGWINSIIDIETPDTDGSVTTTSITELGFIMSYASTPRNSINTWVDYFRYGDGYTSYGTGWDFDDVYTLDNTNGYGIVEKFQGGYFLYGALQLGRSSEQTTFSETGSVLTFGDAKVSTTLYGLQLIGYSTSTFSFTGCVLTAAGTQNFYLDFDDTSIADLDFLGNTVQKASTISFRDSSTQCVVTGNVFDNCTTLTTNGCTFNNNTLNTITTANIGATTPTGNNFSNITNLNLTTTLFGGSIISSEQIDITTGSAGLNGVTIDETDNTASMVLWDGVKTLTQCHFENTAGSKHAVEMTGTSVPSSITWDSTFNSSDFTVGPSSTGTYAGTANTDAVIYINPTSSVSTDITINAANGDSPSVRKGTNYTGTITVNLAANPNLNVTVKDASGSPLQNAWVYIHDGVSQVNNTQTNVDGEITEIEYAGGQSTSTLRVRLWGYYHYEATIGTSTDANITVTLVDDAQQVSVPTLTDSWTDVPASETFGWTSGTNTETVADVYGWLMNKYAATAYMQYQSPMKSITATQYELINGWDFTTPSTDYQHLTGGTIVNASNNQTFSNVTSIGSIGSGTNIYVVQNDALITSWWSAGHIDILVEVRNSSGAWIASVDDSNTSTDGGVWVFARNYGDLYSSFFVDLSGGGRSTIPIATAEDLNNQTANATVAGYTDITVTFGSYNETMDSTNYYDYDCKVDCNGRPLSEVYEYLKYITSKEYSQTVNGDNGYEYRNANEATYTGSDIASAPFGTYAGGTFFGARGLFITNMIGSDSTKYELIDETGVKRYPPITVSLTLTDLKSGSEIRIYRESDMVELDGIESSSTTFSYNYTYSTDIPVIVIVHSLAYEYLSLETTLTNADASIPIQQRIDRNYAT